MKGYNDNWVEKYLEFWKDLFDEWRKVKTDPEEEALFYEELVDELTSIVSIKMEKEKFKSKEGKYLIDPFTIIYSIHTAGRSKKPIRPEEIRIKRTSKKYDLPVGTGQPLQPSPKRRFFFDPDSNNIEDIVPKLWEFGERISNYDTIEDLVNDISYFSKRFKEIRSEPGIRVPKLTQGLFLINPKIFCPYDSNAIAFSKTCNHLPKVKEIENEPEIYVRKYLMEIHYLNFNEILNKNMICRVKYKTVWFSGFIYLYTHNNGQHSKEEGNHNGNHNDQEKDNLREEERYSDIDNLLKMYGQVVLYGPPGTGKTFLALKYVDGVTCGNKDLYEVVTFHPSYSYEEFVEGYRAVTDEKGRIMYKVEDGVFKDLARRALEALLEDLGYKKGVSEILKNPDDLNEYKKKYDESGESVRKFYLVIDEINRGDLARILGELITCLEMDKRLFGENYVLVTLPYSKELFAVPPNLYIIGTMNTADKSIALVDYALRRRFAFLEIPPDPDTLVEVARKIGEEKEELAKHLKEILEVLNERIESYLDRDHRIGHSYFLEVLAGSKNENDAFETFKEVWVYRIMPLLQEYFYNRWDDLAVVLGGLSSVFLSERGGKYHLKDPREWMEELNNIEGLEKFRERLKGSGSSQARKEEEG